MKSTKRSKERANEIFEARKESIQRKSVSIRVGTYDKNPMYSTSHIEQFDYDVVITSKSISDGTLLFEFFIKDDEKIMQVGDIFINFDCPRSTF